jgi:hypothetical protein
LKPLFALYWLHSSFFWAITAFFNKKLLILCLAKQKIASRLFGSSFLRYIDDKPLHSLLLLDIGSGLAQLLPMGLPIIEGLGFISCFQTLSQTVYVFLLEKK